MTTFPSPADGLVPDAPEATRRDFLLLTMATVGVAGALAAAWPFLDSLNPDAGTRAVASITVDLSPVAVGQSITVTWRGKPVFIRHRTPEEIAAARRDDGGVLLDAQPDGERTLQPEWLIVVGICTHLGCVPLGQKTTDPRGDFGGWFCPCHGSQYDTSGRVRRGPAPLNLAVPPHRFVGDTTIQIG